MTPPQDDQNITPEEEAQTSSETFEDIESSIQKEMNAVEEAEQAVASGFSAAQAELQILKDALARSQADYRNLLARVEREKSEIGGYITSDVVLKLLPIIDNLERALTHTPEDIKDNTWVEGMKSIYTLALKQLELVGVKPFDSVGSLVDANLHDVMSKAPGKENVIVAEFERGYRLGDRVIRHAKVVVGSGE